MKFKNQGSKIICLVGGCGTAGGRGKTAILYYVPPAATNKKYD